MQSTEKKSNSKYNHAGEASASPEQAPKGQNPQQGAQIIPPSRESIEGDNIARDIDKSEKDRKTA